MAKLYAIFDLDGTLLDTLDDLMDSMNYILNENNFPIRTRDEIRSFVGNGIRKLVERAVPKEFKYDEKFIDKLYYDLGQYYNKHSDIKTAPYAGTLEMLDKIRDNGIEVAIVSNKIDKAVKSLSSKYFEDRIKVAIGENPKIRHKPEPDMVFMAMQELGANNNNSIYIGDSEVDIQTASNVGIPCISVLWGFRDERYLKECGGRIFVDSMKNLTKKLINFTNK
ncbi:MAG: HAD family hydrolase [Catonella sp.]|uniref:HAD family hydrolase n=1 Tax=Catonella sp. TaxID=2382125 RepID=UPI003FA0ABD6